MKIICLQENLKNALNFCEKIISRNLNLPILNNILLEIEKKQLKIAATNLEIGIKTWIGGKIEKEGGITVPARILSSLINNLPPKKIILETKDNFLNIICENYKAKILGQDIGDFPLIPKVGDSFDYIMPSEIFKQGISQVINAASVSESRPEISGIFLKFEKEQLKLAATDSFRLAQKIIGDMDFNKFNEFIIPQKTAYELIRISQEKLTQKKNFPIKIKLSPNQILLSLDDLEMVSRLIDGRFPDYQQIIPQKFETEIVLEKEDLMRAIKIASFFAPKTCEIKLKIIPQKSLIETLTQSPDLGENQTQIKAGQIRGKMMEINFNYRYLLDGLNNIEDKKIILNLNHSDSPALLKPQRNNGYLYLIMPIKG